jgi:glyoxylase-like metal-dependent hydrolase (beta-lactamase superfamily II)
VETEVFDSGWPGALPRPGNQELTLLNSVAPWFEVYQVGPGTFALLEPRHHEEVISYLILGSERAMLFDTGMGIGNIRTEVERLTDRSLIVVNSHSHYDHIGDNHRFTEVWAFDDPGEVACIESGLPPAICASYLRPGSYQSLPPGFDPRTYEIQPSPVTRRLSDGEIIDLGGRTLTVHHTPGHSPGSLCLLDCRDGLLFTGDTVYPGMLYAHFDDSDWGAYQRSIDHLAALLDEVSFLCPGHNEALASKELVSQVADAFELIDRGAVVPEQRGHTRCYRFGRFGVLLPTD